MPTTKGLNFNAAQDFLIGAARRIGAVYGVEMSVGRRDDNLLMFVDGSGDAIAYPNEPSKPILCCNLEEISNGDWLKLFAARAQFAALALRLSETPDSVE